MDTLSILLLDDSREAASVEKALQERQWRVNIVHNVGEAASHLRENQFHLLLIHTNSSRDWGALFEELPAADGPPMLIMAREPQIEEAVAAVRAGAVNYLEASVSPSRLIDIIERTVSATA
ncbi:MAG: hypothetical protein P8Y63_05105, partial [Deltaproteobacteria bacterium]